MRVLFAALLVLALLQGTTTQAPDVGDAPKVLAQSDFLWDADGWTTSDPGKAPLVHGQKMVKAADTGADEWYFVAPDKFLGAKREAYGGSLAFRHGFFEYDSDGQDMSDGFDVVLSSEVHGLEVRQKFVVPAWAFRSEHELSLVETAGWELASTGGVPSRPDMLRLLSSLSGLRIRGGYYAGHEDSYIASVRLVAGPQDASPPKTSLKAQHIVAGGRSTITAPYATAPPKDDGPPPPPRDEL